MRHSACNLRAAGAPPQGSAVICRRQPTRTPVGSGIGSATMSLALDTWTTESTLDGTCDGRYSKVLPRLGGGRPVLKDPDTEPPHGCPQRWWKSSTTALRA